MKSPKHLLPKVLIVDDDVRNIAILSELLEEDYRITTASSGNQALERLAGFRPDLVLLDIMMPGMDGLEVCRRIREDKTSRFSKVLMISGKVTVEDRLAGYAAGADDYITKPFDHDEIKAKLEVFVKLKSMQEINRIKREFLNLMAHETNTPLNGILGLADYILDDKNLDVTEIRELVQEISEVGQNLMQLIRKILLLVNLTGPIKIDEQIEDFSEAVGLALDARKTKAMNRDVSFEPSIEPCRFPHDRELSIKAICLILDNAIEHAPESSKIELVGQRIGELYRLDIVDRGKGIPPENLEEMTDEFTVSQLSHHKQGHGLGLAIVKRIAEMHGGSLVIESVPGHGTCVAIELPTR